MKNFRLISRKFSSSLLISRLTMEKLGFWLIFSNFSPDNGPGDHQTNGSFNLALLTRDCCDGEIESNANLSFRNSLSPGEHQTNSSFNPALLTRECCDGELVLQVDTSFIGDQEGQDHGVYCRKIKNKLGLITCIKYEPRLKRDRQALSLGQYKTYAEAKLVRDIALFFYENNKFGWLDFEDGHYCTVEPDLDRDSHRYFFIPALKEEKEGKEKSKLVSRKAKEVYNEFKRKQAEYLYLRMARIPIIGGVEHVGLRGDNMVSVEGHVNEESGAATFDLMNSALQQPSHNDQAGNATGDSAFNDMLDDRGPISNISSDQGNTHEAPPFVATNPLPLLDHHELLQSSTEGIPALAVQDSQTMELSENHAFNHEAMQPILASVPLPNNKAAGGFYSNSSNQVTEAFLRQVVDASQNEKQGFQQLVNYLQQENQELRKEKEELRQEKQELRKEKEELRQEKQELRQEKEELKQKNCELKTQLSELQRKFTDHMLVCSQESRPPKRR
jgi:hypothetical protein